MATFVIQNETHQVQRHAKLDPARCLKRIVSERAGHPETRLLSIARHVDSAYASREGHVQLRGIRLRGIRLRGIRLRGIRPNSTCVMCCEVGISSCDTWNFLQRKIKTTAVIGVDAGGDTFTVGHGNLLCTIECTLGLLEV